MELLSQVIVNSIIAGALYALVAVGFNLAYNATKFFNLSYGTLAAAGGYTVLFVVKSWGAPLLLGILGGIGVASLLAFALEKAVFLPIRRRKGSNMVLLVASLGVFAVLQAALAIIFTSQFQSLPLTPAGSRIFEIGSATFSGMQALIVVSLAVVAAGAAIMLKYTAFGKAMRAVSDDEEVAKVVGINTEKIIGHAWLISGGLAGLVGILVGFDTGLQPTMGLGLLLPGVVAAIIGGMGSLGGAILGGFLLGFVENFGILAVSGSWKETIAFSLLMLFLLFRPQGIVKR